MTAHHGDVHRERRQQSEQGLGDPAAAHDGDSPTRQLASRRRAPLPCPRPGRQPAQAGEAQSQGMLGDGPGIGPLGACPDSLAVDNRQEAVYTRKRQLNPPYVGCRCQQFAEPGRVEGIGPYQRFCIGDVHDHAASRANGVGDDRSGRLEAAVIGLTIWRDRGHDGRHIQQT